MSILGSFNAIGKSPNLHTPGVVFRTMASYKLYEQCFIINPMDLVKESLGKVDK